MCQRQREQEDRDIIKCTVLLLSLCPKLHVPTDCSFSSFSFFCIVTCCKALAELPGKSLLPRQSLPHFLSSTFSCPAAFHVEPAAHAAPYWKEAQKYFELKLSWQHQCLDQKNSGGGMRRPNCASQRLLCCHDESQPRPFPLLWAQTFIHCADCWTVSIKGI